MLKSLEALVRCESPTEDLVACREVISLASELAREVLGDPGKILEVNGRPIFWLGDENPRVVLLGHLDTVWPKGSFEPLWEVNGDVIRGPGVFDMKAGFIQALYALQGIQGRVALVASSDEETGSVASKELIQKISQDSTIVLVLEASLDGKVKTGRKGTSMYQIEVHGRAAHAGLEPEKGINATVEISRIVLDLAALENPEFGTTVVPTVMRSGNTTNTVPDHAVLDIDARSFSQAELIRVDAAIRKIAPLNSGATLVITGGLNRPPMDPTSTQEIYAVAEKVAQRIGITLGYANVGGASDGNFAAEAGARVLDGLGAIGAGAHAQNEWASVSALEERTEFLHELVLELLHD
ncbi:MAG: M20/M25/M40 family metallo-hydrolase [Actinobacteria bacterium]|nr:M20/M25/M40 family metallo-hydrolase [Actinomycetota bacterium]